MRKLLIKLSGELFSYDKISGSNQPTDNSTLENIKNIVAQIKKLSQKNHVGLVLGGGNFFRGAKDNGTLGLEKTSAHTIGMLSTIVNGVVLKDLLTKEGVPSVILSAFSCPKSTKLISKDTIDDAFHNNECIIFVGGTGNPFFTTDTNAVLRALQIGADEVWKATKVDGVYESDPLTTKGAKFYQKISYKEVLEKDLKVIDKTAITLAEENNLPIRVFNLFEQDALQKSLENPDFGSTIHK